MKAILISIRPEWCEKIASGEKTVEIRKTRPKLNPPFKVYIYCTIGDGATGDILPKSRVTCGKVIGEFVCDEIYETRWVVDFEYGNQYWDVRYKSEDDCLSDEEIAQYIGHKSVYYGWHISNLVIYDTPRPLADFCLTRPPQSWCYVEEVQK